MVVELSSGIVTGSLAPISDAAHMFADSAALAISLAAVRIARRPPTARLTFGYNRFEILAAAFNALLLFGVAVSKPGAKQEAVTPFSRATDDIPVNR